MKYVILKSVCLVSVFIITFICGVGPIAWIRKLNTKLSDKSQAIISICNCFGGGVFLAVCFLGLLPFAEEKYASLFKEQNIEMHFPVAQFVVVLGFLLIVCLEQCIGKREIPEEKNVPAAAPAVRYRSLDDDHPGPVFPYDMSSKGSDSPGRASTMRVGMPGGSMGYLGTHGCTSNHGDNFMHEIPMPYNRSHPLLQHDHGHSHDVGAVLSEEKGLRLMVLLIAISIHSLFEGIALGLQSEKAKLLQLFIGVSIHEAIVAFALGLRIGQQRKSLCVSMRNLLIFCVTIPLGVAIGIAVDTMEGLVADIVSAVLQSLAAGVFIHVTFLEIIPTELSGHSHVYLKTFFMFLGFLAIACLNWVLKDS